MFIVGPAHDADRAGRLLLIAATGTWLAYNDWGGSNHYEGIVGPAGDESIEHEGGRLEVRVAGRDVGDEGLLGLAGEASEGPSDSRGRHAAHRMRDARD